MSIEDINYLKKRSIRQSYTFLVDSSDRNRKKYPNPSEYSIEFQTPFKNVIGLELLDASIPKTMYNIDINNNRLYFYIGNAEVPILEDKDQNKYYDTTIFSYIDIPPGDYNTKKFIQKMTEVLFDAGYDINIFATDNPPDLTNKIYFKSSQPFILDMHRSTLVEILGFDLYTSKDTVYQGLYTFNPLYNEINGCEKLYNSLKLDDNNYVIYAPGMMYLLGYKYLLLKCPEIEQHLYRSLSYSKFSLGLAKIKINSYGFNDEERTSFMKVPVREFHPIGKLSRLTFRFETNKGTLYDFKGVNHNMTFIIYYYEPKHDNIVSKSILNPEYDPNFVDYLYRQEEQEGESDEDEEDLSRDNLDMFKKRELQFSEKGIINNNNEIVYNTGRNHYDNEKQKQYLKKQVNDRLGDSYRSYQSYGSYDNYDSDDNYINDDESESGQDDEDIKKRSMIYSSRISDESEESNQSEDEK